MKIVFTHGYFIHEDEKEQKIMRPYPPLGILYLSAWLEQHGFDNDVFDTTFSSKEKLKTFLVENKPDVIPIYTNLMTKVNVIETVKFIKSNDALKNATVVLGGPDITYNIDKYLATGADILVIGEGEQTMLEIVQTIAKGNRVEFGHITGLAYKNAEGEIIKTASRQRIRPVDNIPFPNRKKIDLHQYLKVWKTHHGRRSPEKVVDELLEIKEKYNPDSLWFVDDVFTVSHKWLQGFRDEVLKRNAVIPFECITRADRMSEDVIQLLKEAGAFRVWIGAESGSQKIIDAMEKHGIETGTFIMLGYPGETEEDINETIHHLKVSDPDHFTITIAYPIKGTGLYEQVSNVHTTSPDWDTSTDRDIDFKRTYPRKYYDYALRRVINEVNYFKQVKAKKQLSFSALKMRVKYNLAGLGMWWTRVTN